MKYVLMENDGSGEWDFACQPAYNTQAEAEAKISKLWEAEKRFGYKHSYYQIVEVTETSDQFKQHETEWNRFVACLD